MVVNARPLKRMKSRVTADLYDFLSFPSPTQFPGAFRTNIRGFLAKHAMMPPPSSLFPHLMTWQIQFRVGDENASESPDSPPPTVVCLDIIEEDVARSRSIYCDQCRVVGEFINFLEALSCLLTYNLEFTRPLSNLRVRFTWFPKLYNLLNVVNRTSL